MTTPVGLMSLVTAQAPYELLQSDVVAAAQSLFGERFPQFERMAPVFENAGIRTRQAVRPIEWFFEPRDWAERNDAYLDGAMHLYSEAAAAALDPPGLTAAGGDT